MSARDEAVDIIRRICPAHLSAPQYAAIIAMKFDAHRAETLREAADYVETETRNATGRRGIVDAWDIANDLAAGLARGLRAKAEESET